MATSSADERLVEQQQPGLGRERTRQRDTLRLAARQRDRTVRGMVREADALEPPHRPRTRLGPRHPAGAHPERDVLERRECREQEVVLEHDANRPSLGRHEHADRRVIEELAVELDASGVDGQQAGEAAERSRLSRAVRPEEGDRLTAPGADVELEMEPTQRAPHLRLQGHGAGGWPLPRNRSRSATSTPNETAMSTRLNTIASSGLVSFAR